MHERVSFLRERALTSRYMADPDGKRLREESLAQTEAEPPVLREAKALAHVWRHRPIAIHEGEPLVGCRPGLVYGAERSTPHSFGRQRFEPWWPMSEQVTLLIREGVLSPAGNHTTLDYEAILSGGFEGLIARIEARKARLAPDVARLACPAVSCGRDSLLDEPAVPRAAASPEAEKSHFLDALRIVAEGYIAFCRRHADLAEALARSECGLQPVQPEDGLKAALQTEDGLKAALQTEDGLKAALQTGRRAELETIASHCRRVVAAPPRTFWEACQALWFAFLFSPDAPGRVDVYLAPFYERDIAAGTLTRDFAKELLACLWLKIFEFMGAEAAVAAHQHLTLGGTKADGSDASSEVTRLCLEVTEELAIQRPQVGFRWHRGTPPDLLRRAVRTLRTQSGSPDFCSDESIVPALVRTGIAIEDARDFSLSGCHEVIVTGKAQMGAVEGFINLPKLLRRVLALEPALDCGTAGSPSRVSSDGRTAGQASSATAVGAPPVCGTAGSPSRVSSDGRTAGQASSATLAAALDSLDSFDKLWAALEQAMDAAAAGAHDFSLDRDRRQAEIPGGILTASLVTNDCIERCLGYTQGGARYNHCNWDAIGIVNLADSLAAIRRLVYNPAPHPTCHSEAPEEPLRGVGCDPGDNPVGSGRAPERCFDKLSMTGEGTPSPAPGPSGAHGEMTLAELADILRGNWEGHEDLRLRILNRLPHFGNDDPEADALAGRIIESLAAILRRRTPFRGGQYTLGTLAGGENMHIEFGRVTGATPDGRRAGEPLADSLAAAQGRDRRGLTAMLNSVASLPHRLLPTSTTVNVKLDPKLLESDAGIEKVAALIEAHFRSGGQQLQFNFYSRETLLEARRCPEKHAGLMVRVAGYSAPFISLWEDLQDEIIARTEHGV